KENVKKIHWDRTRKMACRPIPYPGGLQSRKAIFCKLKIFLQMESIMSQQGIVGIVLLVIGAVVLMVGMNASHSVADQISNTFTGRFTRETAWYIIGGGAAALFGLLLVVNGVRGKKA